MLGVIFGVLSALFQSIESGIQKRVLADIDEYFVGWGMTLATIPFLVIAVLIQGVPQLGAAFWPAIIGRSILDALALILYLRAIRLSDLSLTMPFISFTPVFLLILGPLLLGETIGVIGALGVILIGIGAYVLTSEDPSKAFKSLLSEQGPRLMLLVSLMWSFSFVLHGIGLAASSPTMWALTGSVLITIVLCPVLFKRYRLVRTEMPKMFLIGFFTAGSILTQFLAIQYLPLAYVSALKRLAIVFSVLIGITFFGEQNWKRRITGASVMVLGAILITLN